MKAAPLWLVFLLGVAVPAQDRHPATLLNVKRVHVEKLGGGETALQIRDMIIASLQGAGLFALTENPDRADAFLRGSAEDLIYNDTHDVRDGITARGTLSMGSRSSSSRRSGGFYTNSSVGENDSVRTVERKHEAAAAVRLVNLDGDIIWSTVQESKGAKFRGASSDVADKITRQLVKDYQRARKLAEGPVEPAQKTGPEAARPGNKKDLSAARPPK